MIFDFLKSLLIIVCALCLNACSQKFIEYPDFEGDIPVFVSEEALPVAEVNDYAVHIADSQIYVSKEPSATNVGVYFGAFGALAGLAIDRANTESAFEKYEDHLHLHFEDEVMDVIDPAQHNIRIADSEEEALFTIVPSVEVFLVDENNIKCTYRINAIFHDNNQDKKSRYCYLDQSVHKLEDANGKLYTDEQLSVKSKEVFKSLLNVFQQDIDSTFTKTADGLKKVDWRSIEHTVVSESGDYLILRWVHPDVYYLVEKSEVITL